MKPVLHLLKKSALSRVWTPLKTATKGYLIENHLDPSNMTFLTLQDQKHLCRQKQGVCGPQKDPQAQAAAFFDRHETDAMVAAHSWFWQECGSPWSELSKTEETGEKEFEHCSY